MFPSGDSITDVKACDCYAVSSIDPFDECEGSESCGTVRCPEDKCAGLAAFCDESTESCRMMLVAEEDTAPPPAPAPEDSTAAPSATMDPANQQQFADSLTKILYTEPNECTSSLGVSVAFSLIYPGATFSGITEIKDTFGYPDGSNLQLVWESTTERMLSNANGECDGGIDQFTGTCWSEKPLLKIANSVWLDSNDTLNEEYAKVVDEYVMQTDFESAESPLVVNDWVNASTNGMIDSIVDPSKPLSPPDVLLAINSIYLKARWVEQFQEWATNLDTFYSSPSRDTKVGEAHFMHANDYYEYSHDAIAGYQIIKLRLQSSSPLSMIFVLPMTDGAAAVTSTDLIDALDKLESTKVALALPKFRFESEYDANLKAALMALGVESPFVGGTNSLCAMLQDYDCAKLIITKVIQKTVIDVNEKGVEAAAVTAVGVGLTAMPAPETPVLMQMDHPFQFFIYDGAEELMLFEGRLGAPDVPEEQPSTPLLDDNHANKDFWMNNFGVSPIKASVPSTGGSVTDCSSLTTCNECLENESCAHWTIGECMSSCMVADVACWTTTGGFADMTADEICTKADDANKDSALCGSMKDCTSCLEATKSDGKSCMWFEDEGFCDTGCNMIGCGTTDISTCSGSGGGAGIADDSPSSTSSTAPAGDDDGTTTTTTTTSTAPPAGIDKIEDPDSSGNTRNLFTFAWTSVMMAFVLSCVVA